MNMKKYNMHIKISHLLYVGLEELNVGCILPNAYQKVCIKIQLWPKVEYLWLDLGLVKNYGPNISYSTLTIIRQTTN